jgi:hypothetical protein
VILSIPVILNISIRAKPIKFARSTECPRFSNKNPLKPNENNSKIKIKKLMILNKKLGLRLLVFANNKRCLIKRNKE